MNLKKAEKIIDTLRMQLGRARERERTANAKASELKRLLYKAALSPNTENLQRLLRDAAELEQQAFAIRIRAEHSDDSEMRHKELRHAIDLISESNEYFTAWKTLLYGETE